MDKIIENIYGGILLTCLLQRGFAGVSKIVFTIRAVPCYHTFNMTKEQKNLNGYFP